MNFVENIPISHRKLGNRKEKQCISLVEIYREFRSRKIVKKINSSEFVNICKDFYVLLHDAMVTEAFEFNPRCNLGKFSIRQRKIDFERKMKIDYHATKKAREETGDDRILIRHTNIHSSSYYYYHHWKKGRCIGVMMWAFKPTHENKHAIARAVKENRNIKPFKPRLHHKSKLIV